MTTAEYQWEVARLTKLKSIIEAFDDAILALGTNMTILEYNLDTSQSKQRVTRQDLPRLIETRAVLFQQYDSMCARLTNGGSTQVLPGFPL